MRKGIVELSKKQAMKIVHTVAAVLILILFILDVMMIYEVDGASVAFLMLCLAGSSQQNKERGNEYEK